MDNYTQDQYHAFEQDLMAMGINPANLRSDPDKKLPPLPASDPMSLQSNRFDGFYNVGARDYWKYAQTSQDVIEEIKPCEHYFAKRNAEVICTKCNVGWRVPDRLHVLDGKLYDNDQLLQFAH